MLFRSRDDDDDDDHDRYGRNDDRDENGNRPNVEVWSYTVTTSDGKTTTMTEKIKFTKSEIKVRMLTVKYNNGSVQTLPPNSKHFEWSLNSNGSIKEFEEKMTVQRGQLRESVRGKYSSSTGKTKLDADGRNPDIDETDKGLVLLTLGTKAPNDLVKIGRAHV